ncbi:uncharacterized protein LOC124254206 [Haliotis rubra]|uniref:uncharacterized protein LOC124254206 n=1 Tax=Haliotis rubra TaxID=36100 RepID=UPI001EE54396|nr:uncharacterized protein LOC124254206 [Haliotis rubra]
MDYIFLVFLVHGVQCINTSQWTAVSRHRVDTLGGFWNSSSLTLIECVYMCLHSQGCKAVATKSTTKPRERLCVFRKHGSLQGDNIMFLNRTNDPEPNPEEFLLYEPRHTITIMSKNPLSTDIINKVPPSRNSNSFEGLPPEGHPVAQRKNAKQNSAVISNPLDSLASKKGLGKTEQDLKISLSGLIVIQQYNRSRRRALYTFDVETWTFLQHRMDVKGTIIKVVFDLKKNVIYRVECGSSSRASTLKSTSLTTLAERRLFDLPTRNVDLNVQDNGLYVVTKTRTGSILIKKELVYMGKNDKTLFTFPHNINVDHMQSVKVDPIRNKVYWLILSRRKVLLYVTDFSSETKPVHIVLKTRNAYLYLSTELYWADDQGVCSVADFKKGISKHVTRCGFHVNSVSTVGRYNGYWYLTCYSKKGTRIRIYDGEMKLMKELQVKFKGIVVSE